MTAIPQDVLSALDGLTFDGSIARIAGQLDRALYTRTDKVLQALGGKWDRRAKGHVFTGEDAAARVEEALLTGTYERAENFDYFPTPPELAREVVRRAGLRDGMSVLEPSAGDGALCDAALAGVPHDFGCDVWDFHCFEIRPDLRAKLGAKGLRVDSQPDFIAASYFTLDAFDRVVMNPPFSRQQDVDHVTHALNFLAPDGLLVAIMSAGVEFRQTKKTVALRELIAARGGSITRNPEGSFKPSGTNVNTVMVVIPGGAA